MAKKKNKLSKTETKALRTYLMSALTMANEMSFSLAILIQTLEKTVPDFGKLYQKKYEAAKEGPSAQRSETAMLQERLVDVLIHSLSKKRKKA